MRSPQDETGIETESSASQGSDSLMEGHSPRGIQGSSLSSREGLKLIDTFPILSRKKIHKISINAVNFSMLTHRNTVWKDFCERRTTDTVEGYQRWYNRMHARNRFCKCYGFDPTCWSETGDKWMKHVAECRHCRSWLNTECQISGHSVASKRTTLIDIRERRFTPGKAKGEKEASCCTKELCTHEFWTHGKVDVPWWTCYNETCAEHYAMKAKNRIKPTIPIVTILNNDTCLVCEKDVSVDSTSDTCYIGS